MKKYEELDITDPFIFAKVMSDKRLCKPLLESILNIKIRDIKYVDYEETIQIYMLRMRIIRCLILKCRQQRIKNYQKDQDIIREL